MTKEKPQDLSVEDKHGNKYANMQEAIDHERDANGKLLKPITIDSEEMRMLGTHLNAHVFAFQEHGKKTMVHYLAIGMVLKEAKDRLDHGQWLKWIKKYGPSLPTRTAQRHLVPATYLQLKDKTKYATVAHLLSDAKHEVTPELAAKVAKLVPEVDGKTFKEMGVALHVIKDIKTKRKEKAADGAKGPKGESQAARLERLSHEAFMRWKGVSLDFAKVTKHLPNDDHKECIAILTEMLSGLTGGKVTVKHD